MTLRNLLVPIVLGLAGAATATTPVDHPDTEGLEPAVAEQIRELRAGLRPAPDDRPAEAAVRYAELGALYHSLDFFEAALACYRNAESLAPGDGRWPYLQGVLFTDRGELQAARRALLRALAIQPNLTTAWARLGRLSLDEGDARDALLHFRRALERLPDSAAAHAGAGQALLELDRPREAVEHLERALELEPRADRLHYPLAMAHRALGETQKMQAHLDRVGAIGVAVDDPIAEYVARRTAGARVQIQQGNKAYRAGDYGAAVEHYRRATEASPDLAAAWTNLGVSQAAMGDREAARRSLRRSLDIEPANQTALENLVTLLTRDGDDDQARSLIDEYMPVDSDNPQLLLARARLRRADGKPAAASGDYRRLTEMEPGDTRFWRGLIVTRIEAGGHDEIAGLLERAENALGDVEALKIELTDALIAAADNEDNAALASRIARDLYAGDPGAAHAERVVRALLRGPGGCSAAARWLQESMDAAGQDEGLRADLRAIRGSLESSAQCAESAAGGD